MILYITNNAELLQKENNNSAQNTMIMFVSISILVIFNNYINGYVIKLTIRKPLALLQNDMEKESSSWRFNNTYSL